MRLSKQNFKPAVVAAPNADVVLVLAPHMDDETIGCGGVIRAHVVAGVRVEVVFITDGAQGFESTDISAYSSEERIAIRKREAASACELLGISRIHYLELPDGRSSPDEAAVGKLLAVFNEVQPDLVYLPFITDTHHDHLTTNKLFFAAAARNEKVGSVLCCCYEVWTPLHPNCIVDISAHIDEKMAALGCYDSQLQMNNYLSSVKGLNAYRAIANDSQGYAEAFYLTTAADYRSLAKYL